jgi:N-methylhydantoinase B
MDPITLEIFRALYTSVAEEMGTSLRRSAFSPNIKERRDYSCAVFDRRARLVAQGDHMPVHLGSMPAAVAAAVSGCPMAPGDIVALNDPFAGGTHLPDITLVAPIHGPENPLWFYVAARAHHADVGGGTPGSMGLASDVYGEGLRIPPVRLVRGGRVDDDMRRLILANMRGPEEREGDLSAQIGAMRTGATRLSEIVERYGFELADRYADGLIEYTARRMRACIASIPDGSYSAEDWLDDDGMGGGPVRIAVEVTIAGDRARIDFAGSSEQRPGPVNAVASITLSAVYYVFRTLVDADVPASAGVLEPIEMFAPEGTVVNARLPAAVAGGNVETSQRIVDTLYRALARALPGRVPAASQGTMNNLTIGGLDPRTGRQFSYYETVGGGMGARPESDGLDAVHTHMTNSLNTPVEALEYAYPLRVLRYGVRRGSGGTGRHRGGDGIVREVELLADARVSILSDRRVRAPYGLAGGAPGATGRNELLRANGERESLPGVCSLDLKVGDRVCIETPGGGGHGSSDGLLE